VREDTCATGCETAAKMKSNEAASSCEKRMTSSIGATRYSREQAREVCPWRYAPNEPVKCSPVSVGVAMTKIRD
jgi:hypothetical protein